LLVTHETARNDPLGLARLARKGFFKPVYVKSLSAHAIRSPIVARNKLVGHRLTWAHPPLIDIAIEAVEQRIDVAERNLDMPCTPTTAAVVTRPAPSSCAPIAELANGAGPTTPTPSQAQRLHRPNTNLRSNCEAVVKARVAITAIPDERRDWVAMHNTLPLR
jgi:hypothetical protein